MKKVEVNRIIESFIVIAPGSEVGRSWNCNVGWWGNGREWWGSFLGCRSTAPGRLRWRRGGVERMEGWDVPGNPNAKQTQCVFTSVLSRRGEVVRSSSDCFFCLTAVWFPNSSSASSSSFPRTFASFFFSNSQVLSSDSAKGLEMGKRLGQPRLE